MQEWREPRCFCGSGFSHDSHQFDIVENHGSPRSYIGMCQ